MLKKISTFLLVVLLIKNALGHIGGNITFRTGIFAGSTNASLLRSQHLRTPSIPSQKLDWPGIGFSLGVTTETRFFSNFIFLNFELGYLNTKATFHSDDFTLSAPVISHYLKNDIAENQLELPIYLRLHSSKKENSFYVVAGVGLKYIFLNKREVKRVSFHMNTPDDKTITPVLKGRFGFANEKNTGGFFLCGVGKNFELKESILAVEVHYMQDLKTWYYPITYNGIENIIPIDLKTISLRLVYKL